MSFKDKTSRRPADFKGKKIGNWGFGNEFEIFAALTKAGLDPAKDVTLVQQEFDMIGLLAGDIDAAEAMTYNEYAQVLEAKNPDDRRAVHAGRLQRLNYEDVGVGMLQDAIWADGEQAGERPGLPGHRGTRSSPRRSRAGSTAATTPRSARDIVVAKGSKLGDSHQLWQMNEINKLDLAVADGHRHHRHGGVGPHRRDRPEHARTSRARPS